MGDTLLTKNQFIRGFIKKAGIFFAFWNEILSFLKATVKYAEEVLKGIYEGATVMLKKIGEATKKMARHYVKVDDHWDDITYVQTVSESEIPSEIKHRLREGLEEDITQELSMELMN